MQKFMQIKEYLLELSFLALLIRIVCVGAGIGEALAVISLVLSMAYTKWLTKAKLEQYEELKQLIDSKTDKKDFAELDTKFTSYEGKLNNFALEKSTKRVIPNEQEAPILPGPKRRHF